MMAVSRSMAAPKAARSPAARLAIPCWWTASNSFFSSRRRAREVSTAHHYDFSSSRALAGPPPHLNRELRTAHAAVERQFQYPIAEVMRDGLAALGANRDRNRGLNGHARLLRESARRASSKQRHRKPNTSPVDDRT